MMPAMAEMPMEGHLAIGRCNKSVMLGGLGCSLVLAGAAAKPCRVTAFLVASDIRSAGLAAKTAVGVHREPLRAGTAGRSDEPARVAGLAGAAIVAAAAAAQRRCRPLLRRSGATTAKAATATVLPKVDRTTTKDFRRDLQKSDQYYKFGRTQMDQAMKELNRVSGSELVTEMRKNGFRLTVGDVTFVLAQSYGFCWGVERAVAMAYEARNFFPDKNIWVTNEIIHNPLVNENLHKMGMQFVPAISGGGKDFSGVQQGDVVILPAFGASVDEMAFLKERNVQIVDTTCPWVSKVWTSVEKSKGKGYTSIIHGKYEHEETVATKSFAQKYLVVKNMTEAEYVAQYVLGNGNREDFMQKFAKAMPEDFDPDIDLDRIGVANQTTMLKGETELIGKLFERVMIKKYGPLEVDSHFISFNTICDATQERQDAMYDMLGAEYEAPASKLYAELEGEQVGVDLKSEKHQERLSSKQMEDATKGAAAVENQPEIKRVDMCLVIGGFNSSNTTHLIEIAEEEGVPGYHIDCAERISGPNGGVANSIQHKPLSTPPTKAMLDEGLEVKENFLPDGPVVIGLTSGASTPDSVLGDCMKRVLELRAQA
mmetsp:Transcript_35095/g.111542  ORF Transcript_35095/g.111542 Transcript_35095/m.111542 type:complete len:597 (-) Transcript_35095:153-1943(-)